MFPGCGSELTARGLQVVSYFDSAGRHYYFLFLRALVRQNQISGFICRNENSFIFLHKKFDQLQEQPDNRCIFNTTFDFRNSKAFSSSFVKNILELFIRNKVMKAWR